jgi:hypothetical protein
MLSGAVPKGAALYYIFPHMPDIEIASICPKSPDFGARKQLLESPHSVFKTLHILEYPTILARLADF